MMDGSPAYLLLYKALNGLRDASLYWLNLLSDSIRGVELISDEVEPCIYQNVVSEKLVESNWESKLKETGLILSAEQGGGALTFIGFSEEQQMTHVNWCWPKVSEYNFCGIHSVNKSSNTVPDVAAVLCG